VESLAVAGPTGMGDESCMRVGTAGGGHGALERAAAADDIHARREHMDSGWCREADDTEDTSAKVCVRQPRRTECRLQCSTTPQRPAQQPALVLGSLAHKHTCLPCSRRSGLPRQDARTTAFAAPHVPIEHRPQRPVTRCTNHAMLLHVLVTEYTNRRWRRK